MSDSKQEASGEWMFVEFFGHKTLAGYVSEEEKWGAVCMRIDMPTSYDPNDKKMEFTTQWYGHGAIYCATPISKANAVELAKKFRPMPFDKYDLEREAAVDLDSYNYENDTGDDIPF